MTDALRCVSPASLWRPNHFVACAWMHHAPFAFWLIDALRPRVLVDIGTRAGASYLAFCQAIQQLGLASRAYALRTWTNDASVAAREPDLFTRLGTISDHHYKAFSTLLPVSADQAAHDFDDASIDLLHMHVRDGHEQTMATFETWRPKLSDRAIVLVHGIHAPQPGDDAARTWRELSANHPAFDFTHGRGLGVLSAGPTIPQAIRPLFDADAEIRAGITQLYAQLGAAISLAAQRDHLREIIQDRDHAIQSLQRAAQQERETNLSEQHLLRDRIRNTERALAHARAEIKSICQSRSAALERLQFIETSTYWRASRPLLAALARLPPGTRRHLRQSLKMARWFARGLLGVARKSMHLARRTRHVRLGRHTLDAWTRPNIRHASLRFVPPPFDAPANAIGRYELSDPFGRYVYIPPRRPRDMPVRLQNLKTAPLFSIIVPTYDTHPDLLERTIASVTAQWYENWELIIVDDASPRHATRIVPQALNEPRIRTLFLQANKGTAGATNEALRQAQGDYVVFLDHHDELTVDCLFELALCIDRTAADFIYSDEDKIEPNGEFAQPFFKPDWSPDSIMSTMYARHVMCVQKATLDRVGWLHPEFDGCQDYDLALRITEQTDRIAHIPKVLYHWRILPGSPASDVAANPAAINASRRVRVAALARRGLSATVESVPQHPEYFRVNYHLLGAPRISIIVPTKNNARLLRRCLDSIRSRSSYADYEIIVIDNGSTQPDTVDYLRAQASEPKTLIVRHDCPFNYSAINNLGATKASGSLLLFMNDDTEVLSSDWLERMGGYAQLPHIGAVGAKLLYPDSRKIQHNGVLNLASGPAHAFLSEDADAPGYFMRNLLEYNWIAVTGACMMIQRTKFDAVGGFDKNLPVAYNDVKLCFDLLDQGLYNVVCASVELYHHESASRGNDHLSAIKLERLKRERAYLYRSSPHYFMRDPFHNPNLLPDSVAFELAA